MLSYIDVSCEQLGRWTLFREIDDLGFLNIWLIILGNGFVYKQSTWALTNWCYTRMKTNALEHKCVKFYHELIIGE